MKNKLGLLMLGMSVALVLPIVSQATTTPPDPGMHATKGITVNVESDDTKEDTQIMLAPNLNFNVISDGSKMVNKPGNKTDVLKVRNSDPNANWRIELASKPLKSTTKETLPATVRLPMGAVSTGAEGGSWASDQFEQVVLKPIKEKAMGHFTHDFGTPTIDIEEGHKAGTYTTELTWLLIIDKDESDAKSE